MDFLNYLLFALGLYKNNKKKNIFPKSDFFFE